MKNCEKGFDVVVLSYFQISCSKKLIISAGWNIEQALFMKVEVNIYGANEKGKGELVNKTWPYLVKFHELQQDCSLFESLFY